MNSTATTRGKIIVSGILFWFPLAGVTYQFLHYLLGLRRLGYDPYYIEDSGRWIYDPELNDCSLDASRNIATVLPALQQYGFGDRWAFRGNYPDGTRQCYGMTEEQILRLYREAEAFLNVTAAQEIREEHLSCRRRIFVESDPFAVQVKIAQGNEEAINFVGAHDTHFSFGENLGAPDCDVPIERFEWLPTRQPVAIDLWTGRNGGGPRYTTITTWHNKDKNIEYRGDTYYWTKDREFEKFLALPRRTSAQFELAAGIPDETRELLKQHGWHQIHSSLGISRNTDDYRSYIQESRGEFTVARDQYVRPKTGWFSDRSACYLAAGRPVITQETGFSKFLPTGKGLFGFETIDDILAAVDAIETDYEGNCRAAREIAAEFFDAEKVVGSLMERAGL